MALRAGFEPTRGDPIGFQVQRLNHSAIAACRKPSPGPTSFLIHSNPKPSIDISLDLTSYSIQLKNVNLVIQLLIIITISLIFKVT